MAATTTVPPCLTTSPATQPIRRMLRSRCSREKESSLDRWVRTTSPSSTVTGRPSASSPATSASAIVDLPAPDRPVRKTVTPGAGLALMPASLPAGSAGRGAGQAATRVGGGLRIVAERAPRALEGGQLADRGGQPAGDDVGQRDLLEHPAVGLAGGDPDAGELRRRAVVPDLLRALPVHLGEEALLDPHDPGD